MTFGQTLKQILDLGGVKHSRLASGLGYDASYVSRWTNDIKIPSLKNDDELLKKIAAVILAQCDEHGKTRLLHFFSCTDEKLPYCMVNVLSEAYQKTLHPAPQNKPEQNACYIPGSTSPVVSYNTFKTVFNTIYKTSGKMLIECICASKLSINGNVSLDFFRVVLSDDKRSDQYIIKIHQLVNMDNFKKNIDVCCAAICTFAQYDPKVHYTFYEYDPGLDDDLRFEDFMLVEDQLLMYSFRNPLSGKTDAIASFDSILLAKEFSIYKQKLNFFPKILRSCSYEDLRIPEQLQFFYSYVMNPELCYFLSHMQPICMSRTLYDRIAENYGIDHKKSTFFRQLYDISTDSPKKIVIYRSVLLEYIYGGKIFMLQKHLHLHPEDRIRHLKEWKEKINSRQYTFAILNDVNPLLNREDTTISFFLSRNSGFMTSVGDCRIPIIPFRSVQTLGHFNTFFEHFLTLKEDYCLHNQQAEEFISHAIEILEKTISAV